MKIGTKSLLYGVHQFILHPAFVLLAWWIVYRKAPRLHELCAIITHDWGYWGCENMDGEEGEAHPARIANIWAWLWPSTVFRSKICFQIMGHSRFSAERNGVPLSKLFRADKMATAIMPRWLYLLLGNLTGEIHEYMGHVKGKYADIAKPTQTQMQWLIETQAHMALMGLHGEKYAPVAKQLKVK